MWICGLFTFYALQIVGAIPCNIQANGKKTWLKNVIDRIFDNCFYYNEYCLLHLLTTTVKYPLCIWFGAFERYLSSDSRSCDQLLRFFFFLQISLPDTLSTIYQSIKSRGCHGFQKSTYVKFFILLSFCIVLSDNRMF